MRSSTASISARGSVQLAPAHQHEGGGDDIKFAAFLDDLPLLGVDHPRDDPQIAAELASIRAQRTSTDADIAVLERQLVAGDQRITPAIIAKFGNLLDRKLRGADPNVRREYVHLLVDRVEVGNREIRITSRSAMLERAVVASQTYGAVVPKADGNAAPGTIRTSTLRVVVRRSGRALLALARSVWVAS